jgi:hypothetical protein
MHRPVWALKGEDALVGAISKEEELRWLFETKRMSPREGEYTI